MGMVKKHTGVGIFVMGLWAGIAGLTLQPTQALPWSPLSAEFYDGKDQKISPQRQPFSQPEPLWQDAYPWNTGNPLAGRFGLLPIPSQGIYTAEPLWTF